MIEQTSFLGMPLRTQRQRRTLVVLYYLVLLSLAAVLLKLGDGTWVSMTSTTLLLGGVFGGITIGGPIKLYESSTLPAATGVQTLNLARRPAFDPSAPENWLPLDEREQHERDHAHYTAYRVLRWTAGTMLLALFILFRFAPVWIQRNSPAFAWLFFILILSLPQSVLLWTEPDQPAGELAEIHSTAA